MSSKKSAETINDLNMPYEKNEIGLKGILWFGVGLLLLIVITFVLMWALLNVLVNNDRQTQDAGHRNPLAMSDRERLPPEPRLQLAPGFGVDSEAGRVNLELLEPQAEYRELHKQWTLVWEHGVKDAKSGTAIALPIEEAKERLLSQGVKSQTGADAQAAYEESLLTISESSSGRVASEKRR